MNSDNLSTQSTKRRLVVTSALPYANGPIHIGHLVEYIQTDVWVRFQRLLGHECWYFCADDAHGTAIMLKARELGCTPEQLIEQVGREHLRDFEGFNIRFDQWHSTHSQENRVLVERFWQKLTAKNLVQRKTITRLYDPVEKQFLSDRMIVGACPECRSPDQYGDSCENCGASYEPDQLIDAKSIFGAAPIPRQTEHFFFDLPALEHTLRRWLDEAQLQTAVLRKIEEWLDAGLRPWDITRDAPYFGFKVPDHPDQYFYVWVDAPIGYMAASMAWSAAHGHDNEEFWRSDSPCELHHFIGKDIAYFHILFWPALLSGADLRLPTRVHCHGFLTYNGQKMSKSRGTLIEARQWLRHYDPEYLRYYLAAKLNGEVEDIDFNLEDFHRRINADLVGKLFNVAARCSRLLHQHFGGQLAADTFDAQWLASVLDDQPELQAACEQRNTNRFIRQIIDKTDQINTFLQTHKPWLLVKTEHSANAQGVLSDALAAFRALMIWLSPIMPDHCRRALAQFGEDITELSWNDATQLPCAVHLRPFEHLGKRLDDAAMSRFNREVDDQGQDRPDGRKSPAAVDSTSHTGSATAQAAVKPDSHAYTSDESVTSTAVPGTGTSATRASASDAKANGVQASGKTVAGARASNKTASGAATSGAAASIVATAGAKASGAEAADKEDDGLIDIGQFARIDMRVARIDKAEQIEGADKLLRLQLDIGGEQRTVLAGIRQWYSCDDLNGRLVVMVRNLKSRKTRFGISEGMVLAATGADGVPHLISPDQGATPGMRLS
ncbi:MAG: methionine--tRNA ligase [Gammaproteobacteria bacterium]|nr:methionine--tRNA ligase [Gammaproteobacteria bacterium]